MATNGHSITRLGYMPDEHPGIHSTKANNMARNDDDDDDDTQDGSFSEPESDTSSDSDALEGSRDKLKVLQQKAATLIVASATLHIKIVRHRPRLPYPHPRNGQLAARIHQLQTDFGLGPDWKPLPPMTPDGLEKLSPLTRRAIINRTHVRSDEAVELDEQDQPLAALEAYIEVCALLTEVINRNSDEADVKYLNWAVSLPL